MGLPLSCKPCRALVWVPDTQPVDYIAMHNISLMLQLVSTTTPPLLHLNTSTTMGKGVGWGEDLRYCILDVCTKIVVHNSRA